MPKNVPGALAFATLLWACLARAQQPTLAASELADLSLEELGNLRVTTVALRPERYSDAPASLFVITAEDIRRSGAASLPEALRLAPNLEVARVSGTTYAVSARGFQNVINNKMLVLVDGRMLYTSVLSGVLWDAQDVMLADVERIEVISGPGAALFGANAFAGVINVITRPAQDTQGALAMAGTGRVHSDATLRYGGRWDAGAWRVYAMHIERDNLRPEASHVVDHMIKDQIGFRMDLGSEARGFTLQGDAYDANIDGNGAPATHLAGQNLVARWTQDLGNGSRFALQAYYDGTKRIDPAAFVDRLRIFDIEAQDIVAPIGVHKLAFGAGYRYAIDDTTPTPAVRFVPEDQRLHWASAFGQDEVALGHGVTLTLGARVQTTIYEKAELLPDVRLDWKPSARNILWTAVSRVARTPGRIDRDLFYPGTAPFLIRGGPDFRSEHGTMYEVGYRAQPISRLTFSITGFIDDLTDLRGGRLDGSGGAIISNEAEGRTSGIEAWAMFQATERWRLMAGVLELRQNLHPRPGSLDTGAPAALGNDPRHTVKARSSWRVSDAVDVDLSWRYVSALAYLTTAPAYNATDVRLAWRARRDLELSVVGSNLDGSHVEFDEHGFPARIPRAAYVQVRWEY